MLELAADAPWLPLTDQPQLQALPVALAEGRASFQSLRLRARPGPVRLNITAVASFTLPPLVLAVLVLPCPAGMVPSSDGRQCDWCVARLYFSKFETGPCVGCVAMRHVGLAMVGRARQPLFR